MEADDDEFGIPPGILHGQSHGQNNRVTGGADTDVIGGSGTGWSPGLDNDTFTSTTPVPETPLDCSTFDLNYDPGLLLVSILLFFVAILFTVFGMFLNLQIETTNLYSMCCCNKFW